jgi:hypothetical protein
MKSNVLSDAANRFKINLDPSNAIITEDLLLSTIKEKSPINDDLKLTFVAASNGSALDITIKNKQGQFIDFTKIDSLEKLTKSGFSLEIGGRINKNFAVDYGLEGQISGASVPITVEPKVAKNLTKPITKDLNLSDISSYSYLSGKAGGANSPGALGGIYTLDDDKYLIKQDTKKGKIRSNKVISEYIANKVFNSMYAGVGPDISLVKSGSAQGDEGVYLAVKYFKDGYRDLYQDVAKVLGKPIPKSRFEPFSSDISAGIKEAKYENIYDIVAGSLFLGDFSIHSGNIGVTGDKNAVRIDFGSAFNKMSGEVEYNKKISNRFGGNKNYFQRDYDKDVKLNSEFAKALHNIDVNKAINTFEETINECAKNFSPEALTKFALESKLITKDVAADFTARFTTPNIDKDALKNELVETVKTNTKEIFKQRKQSLEIYASNIELELLIQKTQPNHPIDKSTLSEILQTDKERFPDLTITKHFVDVAMGFKKIKFVDSHNKITPEIKEVMQAALKKQIEGKKNTINKNIKETVENYFNDKQDTQLSTKDLGKKISQAMRENGLTKGKMSNSKLNRICNITAKEIFAAHNKKIGFWEKCGNIIDKFINKLTGSKNTQNLLNEAVKTILNKEDRKVLEDIQSTLRPHSSSTKSKNNSAINKPDINRSTRSNSI